MLSFRARWTVAHNHADTQREEDLGDLVTPDGQVVRTLDDIGEADEGTSDDLEDYDAEEDEDDRTGIL
jgi:hypothetical protein